MNVLIHDQKNIDIQNVLKDNSVETVIISDDGKIRPCTCCWDCMAKTPGQCTINDGYNNKGVLLSKCSQLIVISRCFYGGYSPFVKNVLDRIVLTYQLPFFKLINGEMYHPKRYENNITLSVHFYGEISKTEKETAVKLVNRPYYHKTIVNFYNSFKEIKGV